MTEENIQVPVNVIQASELSRKILKFIMETALSNENCSHVEKAKQLLKEISSSL